MKYIGILIKHIQILFIRMPRYLGSPASIFSKQNKYRPRNESLMDFRRTYHPVGYLSKLIGKKLHISAKAEMCSVTDTGTVSQRVAGRLT